MVALLLLVLIGHDLSLLGFFVLAELDGLLDLRFLVNAFALDQIVLLRDVPLDILLNLAVVYSLAKSVFVATLETQDVCRFFLGLLDLLPRLHLFLLEQGDTVSEELGIAFQFFAAFFGVGECRLLLLEKFSFVLELRVDSILITQIFLLGGNPDDVLAFGAAQIETFTLHSLTAIL